MATSSRSNHLPHLPNDWVVEVSVDVGNQIELCLPDFDPVAREACLCYLNWPSSSLDMSLDSLAAMSLEIPVGGDVEVIWIISIGEGGIVQL